MPTNAAMIAANADRWLKAKIKPEWQASIDKTAVRLVVPGGCVPRIALRDRQLECRIGSGLALLDDRDREPFYAVSFFDREEASLVRELTQILTRQLNRNAR